MKQRKFTTFSQSAGSVSSLLTHTLSLYNVYAVILHGYNFQHFDVSLFKKKKSNVRSVVGMILLLFVLNRKLVYNSLKGILIKVILTESSFQETLKHLNKKIHVSHCKFLLLLFFVALR